jgi:hypothetical protein
MAISCVCVCVWCVCLFELFQEDGITKALAGADLMCAHANSYLEILQRFQELQATLVQSLQKQELRGADSMEEKAQSADTTETSPLVPAAVDVAAVADSTSASSSSSSSSSSAAASASTSTSAVLPADGLPASDLDHETLQAACLRQTHVLNPAEAFHGALFQLFLTETDALEQSIVKSEIPVEQQRAERVARVQALPSDLFKSQKLSFRDGTTGAPLDVDRQEIIRKMLDSVALHFLLLKQAVFSPFLPEDVARIAITLPSSVPHTHDASPEDRVWRHVRDRLSANQVSWVELGLGLCRLWAPSSFLVNLDALKTTTLQVRSNGVVTGAFLSSIIGFLSSNRVSLCKFPLSLPFSFSRFFHHFLMRVPLI